MHEIITGIYKYTNKINGKGYIGQAKDIFGRWKQEEKYAKWSSNPNYNDVLERAIRKYGIDNFNREIIERCPLEKLNEREEYWAEYYNTYIPNGYNVARCGHSFTVHHKTTREQIQQIKYDLEFTQKTITQIAKENNLGQTSISAINNGRMWRTDREYPIRKKPVQRTTATTCNKIAKEKENKKIKKRGTSWAEEYFKKYPIDDTLLRIAKEGFSKLGREIGYTTGSHIQDYLRKHGYPSTKDEINNWYRTHVCIYPQPYVRGQNKKVYRIDEKGNILEEFDKPQDANKKYGLHHTKEICDGKRKSEKGFYWRWED